MGEYTGHGGLILEGEVLFHDELMAEGARDVLAVLLMPPHALGCEDVVVKQLELVKRTCFARWLRVRQRSTVR